MSLSSVSPNNRVSRSEGGLDLGPILLRMLVEKLHCTPSAAQSCYLQLLLVTQLQPGCPNPNLCLGVKQEAEILEILELALLDSLDYCIAQIKMGLQFGQCG